MAEFKMTVRKNMRVTIEKITPHEGMEINVRVHFEDRVGDLYNHAELRLFIPQKDYRLSELKQVTLNEARKLLEKCLSEEWDYKASDWIDPIEFPLRDEEE